MDVIGQEGAIKRITAGNPGVISVSIPAAATTGSVLVLIGRTSGTVSLEELISQLPGWQIMGTVNSTSAGNEPSLFAAHKKYSNETDVSVSLSEVGLYNLRVIVVEGIVEPLGEWFAKELSGQSDPANHVMPEAESSIAKDRVAVFFGSCFLDRGSVMELRSGGADIDIFPNIDGSQDDQLPAGYALLSGTEETPKTVFIEHVSTGVHYSSVSVIEISEFGPEQKFQASYADASAADPKVTALIRPADVQRSIDTDVSNLKDGPNLYTVEAIFDIGELENLNPYNATTEKPRVFFVKDDQPGLRQGKNLLLKSYQIRDADPSVPVTCTFWG